MVTAEHLARMLESGDPEAESQVIQVLGVLQAYDPVRAAIIQSELEGISGWNPFKAIGSAFKTVGKGIGSAAKGIGKVAKKIFTKKNLHTLLNTAQVIGPMVAQVYPPAAPYLTKANSIIGQLKQGIPQAKAEVGVAIKQAQAGLPGGQAYLGALEVAQAMRTNVASRQLIQGVQSQIPQAQGIFDNVMNASVEGNQQALYLREALKQALIGMQVQQNALPMTALPPGIQAPAWPPGLPVMYGRHQLPSPQG